MTNEIFLHVTIRFSDRLLHYVVVKTMGGFDNIDCEIIVFEVRKNVFWGHPNTG